MLYNALLLTFVELLLRGVTMLFQRVLVAKIGAAGLGLLQLVLTVGGFAMTLGLAGLRVTAMYLCAEEYGKGSLSGMQCAIRCCLKTGTIISAIAGLILFFLSDYAAKTWIGDARVAWALRLLAVFLPVNCLCAILSGFFTACDRVRELAKVETVERLAGLALTAALLRLYAGQDAGKVCCAMVLGSSLACLGSTLYQLQLLRRTFSGCREPAVGETWCGAWCGLCAAGAQCVPPVWTRDARAVSHPVGACARRRLGRGLYGGLRDDSCDGLPDSHVPGSHFIHGGRPPGAGAGAVPRGKNTERMHHLTGTCLRMGCLFALCTACLMGALSDGLGQIVYKSADCGRYLLVFAPAVLMLYLDAMVDGMLKGFGEQTACVRYNTLTSFLDVALLYLLLPRFGLAAYVLTFYLTHAINFWLSIRRLLRVTGYPADGRFLLRSAFCALAGLGACCCLPDRGLLPAMVLRAGLFVSVFLLFLELMDTVPAEDHRWLRRSLRL